MSHAKSAKASFNLINFDFKAKEVDLIHRQFSGERSQLIYSIDDLLRCWASALTVNPLIKTDFHFSSMVVDGKAEMRLQSYSNDHAGVVFQRFNDQQVLNRIGQPLTNPKGVLRLYDLAFAEARYTAPVHTVSSYFSLREVVARLSEVATYVDVKDNELSIYFEDGQDAHIVDFKLKYFPHLQHYISPSEVTAQAAAA